MVDFYLFFSHTRLVEKFEVSGTVAFKMANLTSISTNGMLASCGLGFAVSLLFFMDQGVSAQLVDAPTNKLKKGNAPHLDFVLVAIINFALSLFGLPWMHGTCFNFTSTFVCWALGVYIDLLPRPLNMCNLCEMTCLWKLMSLFLPFVTSKWYEISYTSFFLAMCLRTAFVARFFSLLFYYLNYS